MAQPKSKTERSQLSTPMMILISAVAAIGVIALLVLISERDTTPTQGTVATGGDVILETETGMDDVMPSDAEMVDDEDADAMNEDDAVMDADDTSDEDEPAEETTATE